MFVLFFPWSFKNQKNTKCSKIFNFVTSNRNKNIYMINS